MAAVNKDELRESVAQICKLHGVQEANYWDIADQVVTVFTTQLASLIERVETAIPDQKIGTKGIPLNHSELGYNIAIQDVCQALATIKQELIEGSNDEHIRS